MQSANVSKQQLNKELEELENDEDFKRLQEVLAGNNFFKLSGMVKQETKHSYFLFNLFDPNGAYGWGTDFVKDFFENRLLLELPSTFYSQMNAIKREYKFNKNEKRIDLLLYSNDTVVLIENKINADESDNQLTNYEEGIENDNKFSQYNKKYIFLTPDGRLPKNEQKNKWITANYGQIIDSIREMQKMHKPQTQDEQELHIFLEHYIKFLRNYVIMSVEFLDEETKRIHENLSKRYPEATAFMGKRHPDDKLLFISKEISKILKDVKDQYGLKLLGKDGIIGKNGKRIQFKTTKMGNLLKKQNSKANPIIYEVSDDVLPNKSMSAYAYCRNADFTDDNLTKILDRCAAIEQSNDRTPKMGKESHKLEFKEKFDIDSIYEGLQIDKDDPRLREQIINLLEEIRKTENEIEQNL